MTYIVKCYRAGQGDDKFGRALHLVDGRPCFQPSDAAERAYLGHCPKLHADPAVALCIDSPSLFPRNPAMRFEPLDFSKIRTYPVAERANKVSASQFATPHIAGGSLRTFLGSLPDFLAVSDLRRIVVAMADAVRRGRPVVLMMGAHSIKVGLNPIFVHAMRRGLLHAVAFNGAGAVHDFELCYHGETSEDVQRGLNDGSFGMVDETGRWMNAALEAGVRKGLGAGRSLGEAAVEACYPNVGVSILATGAELAIPVTVHIAIGTDIIHQHPTTDGAVLGEATYRDFKTFAAVCARLEGGVVLNVGSAVVMPEVFLKALTIARNLGHKVDKFTTATFDMTRHYRPSENVQRRPTALGGQGFYMVGHHEIMIPLLFAAVTEELASVSL